MFDYRNWRFGGAESPPDLPSVVGEKAIDSFDQTLLPQYQEQAQAFRDNIAAKFGVIPNQGVGNVLRNVLNLAGPVYLPVHFIATQVARAAPTLWQYVQNPRDLDGVEKLPRADEMYRLFDEPNPSDTFRKILYWTSQQIDLTGEAIWWLPNETQDGLVSDWEPLELYCIPTACVTNIVRKRTAQGIEETLIVNPHALGYSGTGLGYGVTPIPARQCLRFDNPHPYLIKQSLSTLTAVGQWVDTLRLSEQAQMNSQKNGLHQNIAVILKGEYSDVKTGSLQRFRNDMAKLHGGAENAGKTPVFPADVDIKDISRRPDQMAWPEQQLPKLRQIMAAFGVNPAVTGVVDVPFSALFAAIKQFHWSCLEPRLEWIADVVSTKWLKKVYGRQYYVNFTLPRIDAEDRLREALVTALSAGLLTVAEARRVCNELGMKLDELADRDYPWVQERASSKAAPASAQDQERDKDREQPDRDQDQEKERERNDEGEGGQGPEQKGLWLDSIRNGALADRLARAAYTNGVH